MFKFWGYEEAADQLSSSSWYDFLGEKGEFGWKRKWNRFCISVISLNTLTRSHTETEIHAIAKHPYYTYKQIKVISLHRISSIRAKFPNKILSIGSQFCKIIGWRTLKTFNLNWSCMYFLGVDVWYWVSQEHFLVPTAFEIDPVQPVKYSLSILSLAVTRCDLNLVFYKESHSNN